MAMKQAATRYKTDLTDEQWEVLRPLVEVECHGPGRPRTLDLRAIVNALLYLVRTGCQWDMLPKDFPHRSSVRYYFDKWTHDGTWLLVNERLCQRVREEAERTAYPSDGIIDSQTVKTTEAGGERGYDGGKSSVVVDIDEMGPESAKSFPGREIVRDSTVGSVVRAKQEIDYGSRGRGYIFGAFRPSDGEAFTHPYPSRSAVNFADFLERVDAWISPEFVRVYAIMDNLLAHRATDVLLFALAHPRWEFVFQPKYAAYLNLSESWWKILRSLALTGRRFETWEDLCRAIQEATTYWNAHRHPFVWGRRPRHQRRRPGSAQLPTVP